MNNKEFNQWKDNNSKEVGRVALTHRVTLVKNLMDNGEIFFSPKVIVQSLPKDVFKNYTKQQLYDELSICNRRTERVKRELKARIRKEVNGER